MPLSLSLSLSLIWLFWYWELGRKDIRFSPPNLHFCRFFYLTVRFNSMTSIHFANKKIKKNEVSHGRRPIQVMYRRHSRSFTVKYNLSFTFPTIYLSSRTLFFPSKSTPCPDFVFRIQLLEFCKFFRIINSGMIRYQNFTILSFEIHKINVNKHIEQK